ncbi:MAG TPA: 3-dehydroquinate synthase, partial [Accumulibacter sp.]|nr:3-dehydroquinate synthase [Accumulibacter sp.]
METLNVALGENGYPIHIGTSLLDRVDLLSPCLRHPKAVVITNVTVGPLYLQRLTDPLRQAGIEVCALQLPDGEQYKNWQTLNSIFDLLLGARCER